METLHLWSNQSFLRSSMNYPEPCSRESLIVPLRDDPWIKQSLEDNQRFKYVSSTCFMSVTQLPKAFVARLGRDEDRASQPHLYIFSCFVILTEVLKIAMIRTMPPETLRVKTGRYSCSTTSLWCDFVRVGEAREFFREQITSDWGVIFEGFKHMHTVTHATPSRGFPRH